MDIALALWVWVGVCSSIGEGLGVRVYYAPINVLPLPPLGCTGDLPGDLKQDFPPGVGNLTVKSLICFVGAP